MKKQETLEEAIKREYETRKFNSDFPFDPQSFKLGAKWQQKRMYSVEINQVKEMSKQTSVDFLIEEFSAILGKVNFTAMQGLLLKDAVEKAREMNEGQIMQAYNDGKFAIINIEKNKSLEQYYNENYKKEEK
jgi:hypothetical protein